MLLPSNGVTRLSLLSLRHHPLWEHPFPPENIAPQAVKIGTSGLFDLESTHRAAGKGVSPAV